MSKPEEVAAVPDEAFDLGYIQGFNDAFRELLGIRDPIRDAIREGDMDTIARLTEDFWVGM